MSWSDSEFSSFVIFIRSSPSSAKDIVHEILDGVRWLDEDRASSLLNIIWVYLRLGCEGACCQPFCSTVNTHISLFLVFNSQLTPSAHICCLSLKLKPSYIFTSVFPVVHVLLIKAFLGTCSGYTPPGLNNHR